MDSKYSSKCITPCPMVSTCIGSFPVSKKLSALWCSLQARRARTLANSIAIGPTEDKDRTRRGVEPLFKAHSNIGDPVSAKAATCRPWTLKEGRHACFDNLPALIHRSRVSKEVLCPAALATVFLCTSLRLLKTLEVSVYRLLQQPGVSPRRHPPPKLPLLHLRCICSALALHLHPQ